jgi:hypothetical protein
MDKIEFKNENTRLGINETSPSERLNIGGQQTAVEWLVEELKKDSYQIIFGKTFASIELIEQAKAMEREQLKKCYEHAMLALLETGHGESFEDYYNTTFKNKLWRNKRQ